MPPGKRKPFVNLLQEEVTDGEIYDIETRLENDLEIANMHLVLSKYPINFLQTRWRTIISQIIKEIKNSEKKIQIIVGHSVYFSNFRREYFTAVDMNHLKTECSKKEIPIPEKLILIIDDLYDVLNLLNERDFDLFGPNTFSSFIHVYKDTMKIDSKDLGSEVYLNWINHCISSLLEWRSQEIMLSEGFANQLTDSNNKCRFMLWALKQNITSLIDWFSGKNSDMYYISHPISEPRKIFLKDNSWPEITNIINDIQLQFLNKEISSVVPTAIDEYRFEKIGKYYTASLTCRWPVPDYIFKKLCDKQLVKDVENIELFRPQHVEYDDITPKLKKLKKLDEVQQYINGVLSTLELRIKEQLSNRDHMLVRLSDGIVVIEPWSEEKGDTHGGIAKEIIYLRQISETIRAQAEFLGIDPILKKVCMILKISTVKALLKTEDFLVNAKNSIALEISKNHSGIGTREALGLIQDNLQLVNNVISGALAEMVDPARVTSEIQPKYNTYLRNAVTSHFLNYTISVKEDDVNLNVILVDDLKKIFDDENLNKINKFLNEDQKDDSWKDELVNFLS